MLGRRSKSDAGPTLIAPGTTVRGDVEYAGQLIVSGVVQGNVNAGEGGSAVLTVSAKGRIEGEVHVPQVEVHGIVEGDVYASNHLKLARSARVTGDVHYKVIEIAEGAEINGRLLRESAPMTERQAAEVAEQERERPKPTVGTVHPAT